MAADFKIKYPADTTALTATGLASLGSSSSFTAGYQLDPVSNRTNLDVTHLLSGNCTVGTTPTVNTQIQIWMIPASRYASGTPVWPDNFTAAAGAVTVTSAGILAGLGVLLKSILVDATTSNRNYFFSEIDLAAANGGTMPFDYAIFVTHNTGVAFNATGGNFRVDYTRVQYQSV